jgi:hypothetical protein
VPLRVPWAVYRVTPLSLAPAVLEVRVSAMLPRVLFAVQLWVAVATVNSLVSRTPEVEKAYVVPIAGMDEKSTPAAMTGSAVVTIAVVYFLVGSELSLPATAVQLYVPVRAPLSVTWQAPPVPPPLPPSEPLPADSQLAAQAEESEPALAMHVPSDSSQVLSADALQADALSRHAFIASMTALSALVQPAVAVAHDVAHELPVLVGLVSALPQVPTFADQESANAPRLSQYGDPLSPLLLPLLLLPPHAAANDSTATMKLLLMRVPPSVCVQTNLTVRVPAMARP